MGGLVYRRGSFPGPGPNSDTNSDTNSDSDSYADSDTDANTAPAADANTDSDSYANTDSDSYADSDSDSYADSDTAPAADSDTNPNAVAMIHKNRRSLAQMFRGTGVELGVAAGRFSEIILKVSDCRRLWSIDRWGDHHGLEEYRRASEMLAVSGQGRCVPLRMSFEEAAGLFHAESLDFVYLDGYAHTGQEGGKTLDQWWPKLKPGGVFAGHDYHPKYAATQQAVDAFIASHGLPLNLTSDANEPKADEFPSWWTIKGVGVSQPVWHTGCPVGTAQSVVLVGNGPSVLMGGAKGVLIDGFDHVVRFNTYALKGFETHTGTKTTLWSTFGRGSKPRDPGEVPAAAIYIHGDKPKHFDLPIREAWGLPRAFYDGVLTRLKMLSVRDETGKKPLLPSSGLVVTAWLLENGVPCVTLVGFDHFSKAKTGMHHYWLSRSFKEPPEHDGKAEALMFEGWVSEGRVRYL